MASNPSATRAKFIMIDPFIFSNMLKTDPEGLKSLLQSPKFDIDFKGTPLLSRGINSQINVNVNGEVIGTESGRFYTSFVGLAINAQRLDIAEILIERHNA